MLRDFFRLNARSLIAVSLLIGLPLLVDSGLTAWLYEGGGSMALAGMSSTRMIGFFAVTAALMGLGLTHTTFVALVSGYFLGWEGFAGTVAAYGVAAAVGYRLAVLIDHGSLLRFLHLFPKAEAVLKELQTETLPLIILVRLSPVLPFALMTFVLAAVRVNFQRFLLGSIFGMLPRTLFFYWLGTRAAGLAELLHHPESTSLGQWLVIGLVIASGAGLFILINQAVRRALQKV
jgi:uncharacterized membrane protein YdjX (TVP38/TMEM64 family)